MKKTPEATFNDVVESFKTFYKIPAGTPKPCEKLINEILLPFAKKAEDPQHCGYAVRKPGNSDRVSIEVSSFSHFVLGMFDD